MLVRLFDVQNGKVIPTEHCYTLSFLKDIMTEYPEDYLHIYTYLFYMTCPNPDMNPFFNIPDNEKEELVYNEVECEFSLEDELIMNALQMCRRLYETPTYRAYKGIASMLDRLAGYMEKTPIEHGRDGNINSIVNAAAKFEQIRNSFKGAYNDLVDEQKSSVRGGQGLSYDQI
jgi:hypothetical protein